MVQSYKSVTWSGPSQQPPLSWYHFLDQLLFSVVVIKYSDQKPLSGAKLYLFYSSGWQSIIMGSQGRSPSRNHGGRLLVGSSLAGLQDLQDRTQQAFLKITGPPVLGCPYEQSREPLTDIATGQPYMYRPSTETPGCARLTAEAN